LFISNFGYVYPGLTSPATQFTLNISIGNPGTYSVYVVDQPPAGTSAAFPFTVTAPPPPPDFTVTSSGNASQTVTAGATATYTNVLIVTPQNGFASAVNLACSIVATATHCAVNPTSLSNRSATVTVTTTTRSLIPPVFRTPWFYRPLLIYVSSFTAVLAAFLLAVRMRRFRLAFAIPAAAIAFVLLLHAAGCGGGGTTPPPPPPAGTPAGSYTINVTATSGNLSHTTTLTLVVN